MNKKFVLSKGNSSYFNSFTKTWVETGQITVWDSSDSLLADLQNMIFENSIDSTDHSIHIREVGFIFGEHGCALCDFVNKNKQKDLLNSALEKLNKNEIEALTNEFRRTHKI